MSQDLVRVATCKSPTEAHLLRGVLQSAGLTAHIADADTVRTIPWLTEAVGGVRLLVPASQSEDALKVIAEFDAGAYQLGDKEPEPVAYSVQAEALFSPDRAAVLGFVFTPVFAFLIHWVNERNMGLQLFRVAHLVWFTVLCLATLATVVVLHDRGSGPFVMFRASMALSALTLIWYFSSGKRQSALVLSTYGPNFRRRSLVPISFLVGTAFLASGWVLNEFFWP